METKFKDATEVSTATVVTTGLIGGWLSARESGIRYIGAVPLVAAGAWAFRSWNAKRGLGTAALLTSAYAGAFGFSHPLAKKIGAWPSVLTVTSGVAAASWLLSDSK